ncbi:MAG: hypothetical protein IGS03_08840 [Candidatus Sericytochromatia bacterium]|nr:hypothetical protein [Candidatus Sericytochromatia bacterium]
MSCLKPSLFYLLHNSRLVKAERLIWALHYQYGRPQDATLSYSQILIAFNALSPKTLTALRESHGPLDEEPLAHLCLEHGLLTPEHFVVYQTLQAGFARIYPGEILQRQLGVQARQIEALLHAPLLTLPLTPAGEILGRRQALNQFRLRLTQGGYLNQEALSALGLNSLGTLPVSARPLADLLVLNGDLPDHLLRLLLDQQASVKDPLLALLNCQGYDSETLMHALEQRMKAEDQGKDLAWLLAEKGLISRRRLTQLILDAYRSMVPAERPVA